MGQLLQVAQEVIPRDKPLRGGNGRYGIRRQVMGVASWHLRDHVLVYWSFFLSGSLSFCLCHPLRTIGKWLWDLSDEGD